MKAAEDYPQEYEEPQRGVSLEHNLAAVIRALIEEREELRALLAAARAHMLGDGDGYDNEVVAAIDAALGDKP